jgi:hypothetical protein
LGFIFLSIDAKESQGFVLATNQEKISIWVESNACQRNDEVKMQTGRVQLISLSLGLSTLASICRTIERCLFESKEGLLGARNESLLLKIAKVLSSSPTATAAAATSAHSTFFLWNLIHVRGQTTLR